MRNQLVSSTLFCRTAPLVSLLMPAAANAALISTDWQVAGDGLIVRDTATHIEWLKLTETFGLSYNQVAGELGAGGNFEGLRYATNTEVLSLFGTYFGISLAADVLGERPAYLDPGARLASQTLGNGVSGGMDPIGYPNAEYQNYQLIGLTAETRLNGDRFALGTRTRWSDTDYFTVKDPWGPAFYYMGQGDSASAAFMGSYLVRETALPLPGAAWLMGAGLVFLGGAMRKRA